MAKKAKKKKAAVDNNSTLATNRRARHDYTILDTLECGMVLVGTEIKSMREGKISLADAFTTIDDGEVYIRNLHIPEYSQGTWTNLLHRREIDKLMGQVRDGNKTLIPLKVYLKDGRAKCELGLAKGKQDYDKREAIKRRDQDRDITRELGRRVKGINA